MVNCNNDPRWQNANEGEKMTPEEEQELNDAISAFSNKPKPAVINEKESVIKEEAPVIKKEPKGRMIGFRPFVSKEEEILKAAAEFGMSPGAFAEKSVNMMLFFVNRAKEAEANGAKDNDDISAPLYYFKPE